MRPGAWTTARAPHGDHDPGTGGTGGDSRAGRRGAQERPRHQRHQRQRRQVDRLRLTPSASAYTALKLLMAPYPYAYRNSGSESSTTRPLHAAAGARGAAEWELSVVLHRPRDAGHVRLSTVVPTQSHVQLWRTSRSRRSARWPSRGPRPGPSTRSLPRVARRQHAGHVRRRRRQQRRPPMPCTSTRASSTR